MPAQLRKGAPLLHAGVFCQGWLFAQFRLPFYSRRGAAARPAKLKTARALLYTSCVPTPHHPASACAFRLWPI